jgi:hypothetical protein
VSTSRLKAKRLVKYLEHGEAKLGTNSRVLRRQPINQFRHHVIRQMIQKLAYRVDSLLARRASCNDNALAALRD